MALKVAIVGGGLAGMTTASSLLRHEGIEVTVFEKKPYLGGQVASWKDAEGRDIETGIHLLFPWYANMVKLYEDLGQPLPLVPSDGNLYVMDGKTGRIETLEGDYRSLFTGIRGILKFPGLSFGEKLTLIRFLFSVLSMPMNEAEQLDHLSVAEFLRGRGMSENLIRRLEIASVTIQGLYAEKASAASFVKFIKIFYGAEGKFNTAFLEAPIGETLVAPLENFIRARGGAIVCGETIFGLKIENDVVVSVSASGKELREFDCVVLAVPAYVVPRLLPEPLCKKEPFSNLAKLHSADVLTLQLHYDERVFPDGNVYVSNRRDVLFDSVCDKAWHWGLPTEQGSIVQVLIDDAGYFLRCLTQKMLCDEVVRELARFFPALSGKTPCAYEVIPNWDVYAETRPGYWSLVPRTHRTPIANLFLAGDYTDGPYHYGMESAVVSGKACANVILASRGIGPEQILPVKFPWPVRLLEKIPLV